MNCSLWMQEIFTIRSISATFACRTRAMPNLPSAAERAYSRLTKSVASAAILRASSLRALQLLSRYERSGQAMTIGVLARPFFVTFVPLSQLNPSQEFILPTAFCTICSNLLQKLAFCSSRTSIARMHDQPP